MRSALIAFLLLAGPLAAADTSTAYFAGGCFWCMEADFEKKEGVTDVISGFTGGTLENPTYQGNHAGHYEAVKVTYDPAVVGYEELLQHFWTNIDPFDPRGQFCDKGFSYKTAIFFDGEEQRRLAEASFQQVADRFEGEEIATVLLPANRFWPVEEYHQDYYKKNPLRYKYYRWNCGRDQRLEEIWGEDAMGGMKPAS
jgi:peptide-methionine (S)-S-oxide reductase